MLRIAVVGSGPSGIYAAQGLVQQARVPNIEVHVLDRLPCPYGLVRYGVAPDHTKIKSLQSNLRTVLEHERITFVGHIEVGSHGLTPERLLGLYHAVVYCVGAARDRQLGIPGEDLPGSHSATDFVSWYSAHPDATRNGFALSTGTAVVIGVGNVAVDVARILARSAQELTPTDVPQDVLDALGRSRVRDVHMVGRRGPSQARFTTKELRELGSLPSARMVVTPADLALDPAYADASGVTAAALPAVNRRNLDTVRTWGDESDPAPRSPNGPRIHLRFFLRPVEFLEADGAVAGVRFERTAPDGLGGVQGTGAYEDIAAGLVLRAVGYRGVPLPGLPFDADRGTVPHRDGRVLRGGKPSPGEYVAGWIKRGPTGVIGTNRPCAKETVASLLDDAGALVQRSVVEDPLRELRASGHRPVLWAGWRAIEAAEEELGRSLGRPSVKITGWDDLLAAALGRGGS
ncbi:FAD-dependent oxidoreductase [Streptomyces sp. NBC_00690]|uniref:FAD-dependent oxidoreductase n=1 Tax=Streptomyces sp. NBC_00690 TaxID=2975808 RepID=UPI002E2A06CA|nr:FAD-dependent oxidoreductase [Streptomyces sp. NBC_00690]